MNRVVTTVLWNCQEDFSYLPELKLLGLVEPVPVSLDDLINKGMGKGSVIDYDDDTQTIIDVITKSDNYQSPTCECGYHMRMIDIEDGKLRCRSNDFCISKVLKFYQRLLDYCTEYDDWCTFVLFNKNHILKLINLEQLVESESTKIMISINDSLVSNNYTNIISSIQSKSPLIQVSDIKSWLKALALIKSKLG